MPSGPCWSPTGRRNRSRPRGTRRPCARSTAGGSQDGACPRLPVLPILPAMAESRTASEPPPKAGRLKLLCDPELLRLLDYWRAKRRGRPMPSRKDIDPTEIPWALGRVRSEERRVGEEGG